MIHLIYFLLFCFASVLVREEEIQFTHFYTADVAVLLVHRQASIKYFIYLFV